MGYKEYDEYGTRLLEYDDNNNLIHSKEKSGFEAWYEYDDRGNQIYIKDSDGVEIWHEFYNSGKLKFEHYKSSKEEYWYEYDENGKTLKGKFMYFPKKLHQAIKHGSSYNKSVR